LCLCCRWHRHNWESPETLKPPEAMAAEPKASNPTASAAKRASADEALPPSITLLPRRSSSATKVLLHCGGGVGCSKRRWLGLRLVWALARRAREKEAVQRRARGGPEAGQMHSLGGPGRAKADGGGPQNFGPPLRKFGGPSGDVLTVRCEPRPADLQAAGPSRPSVSVCVNVKKIWIQRYQ
jgi:hypothetical protein